jgi:hypothetical protein
VREPHAFAKRDALQEPFAVSGHQSDTVSGGEPLSGYEPVTGRELDSVADRVPLARQLPKEAIAVRFDDVRQRHRDLPVG